MEQSRECQVQEVWRVLMPWTSAALSTRLPWLGPKLLSGQQSVTVKRSPISSLLAAYDACATPKEQEMLLSTIKCGQLQR